MGFAIVLFCIGISLSVIETISFGTVDATLLVMLLNGAVQGSKETACSSSWPIACLQTQRLRFDFNLPRGMSGEEVHEVEQLVNNWIQQDHSLATHVVPLQEAKDKGQTAAT